MRPGRLQKLETLYRFSEQFEIDSDSVRVGNIVLCADAASAELFLEKIFPICNECYVASADRSYPKNDALNKIVFESLLTNPKVAVVVFGANALNEISILSERILIMDRVIGDLYSNAKTRKPFRRDVDEFFVAHLLLSFFAQWSFRYRGGDSAHKFRTSREYERTKMGWLLDLIAPEGSTDAGQRLRYEDENIEALVFGSENVPQE